jgi:hypothetical protein
VKIIKHSLCNGTQFIFGFFQLGRTMVFFKLQMERASPGAAAVKLTRRLKSSKRGRWPIFLHFGSWVIG